MSFRSMHDDYLDPDRHLGGGGAADSEAYERMCDAAPKMLEALHAWRQWWAAPRDLALLRKAKQMTDESIKLAEGT